MVSEFSEVESAQIKALVSEHVQLRHRPPNDDCPVCQIDLGRAPAFGDRPFKGVTQKCYDFPNYVLHRTGCPRYTGGVCRPESTPTPPYTDDEAEAVVYNALMEQQYGNAPPLVPMGAQLPNDDPKRRFIRIRATGMTLPPDKQGEGD